LIDIIEDLKIFSFVSVVVFDGHVLFCFSFVRGRKEEAARRMKKDEDERRRMRGEEERCVCDGGGM
jgi:hypothetical protein